MSAIEFEKEASKDFFKIKINMEEFINFINLEITQIINIQYKFSIRCSLLA